MSSKIDRFITVCITSRQNTYIIGVHVIIVDHAFVYLVLLMCHTLIQNYFLLLMGTDNNTTLVDGHYLMVASKQSLMLLIGVVYSLVVSSNTSIELTVLGASKGVLLL